MIAPPVFYDEVQAAVESGVFVAFAAGTCDGKLTLAWLAVELAPRSAGIAYSRTDQVRVAQAIGAIGEVGRQARAHGFTPA